MSDTSDAEFRDNAQARRFELHTGGHTAAIHYEPMEGGLVFVHTLVPKALEGQGVGGRLVKAALSEARDRGLKVRPDCPFVAAYVARHPEFADLMV